MIRLKLQAVWGGDGEGVSVEAGWSVDGPLSLEGLTDDLTRTLRDALEHKGVIPLDCPCCHGSHRLNECETLIRP